MLSQARIIIMPDIPSNVKPYLTTFRPDSRNAVLHGIHQTGFFRCCAHVAIFRVFPETHTRCESTQFLSFFTTATKSEMRLAFTEYAKGMKRDELVAWLDNYLETDQWPDASLNGLQVEGPNEVRKIAIAVDSSLTTFQQAAAAGADFLIVHHGLFWGAPEAVVGMHKRRLEVLLKNDISLYASHLPLDAHKEVGNNWGLARILGLTSLEDFGKYQGKYIGVKGEFIEPISLRLLAEKIEQNLGEQVMVHQGGNDPIRTMGIVSGAAAWEVVSAADQGLDAFLTGEPKHDTFYHAFERSINAMFAGHYMTETVGVNLLARKIEEEFGIPFEFILLPTGL